VDLDRAKDMVLEGHHIYISLTYVGQQLYFEVSLHNNAIALMFLHRLYPGMIGIRIILGVFVYVETLLSCQSSRRKS